MDSFYNWDYNMNMTFENTRIYIETTYNVIEYVEGHYKYIGKDSGVMKNPIWRVLNEDRTECILMYCHMDTICKLCPESYKRIVDYERDSYDNKKITWFKNQSGYIAGTCKLFIHQIITKCYGNGRGTRNISVDHIDRDPLNNTFQNLRIATRTEQEQNTKGIMPDTKRARKGCAKQLPTGITQDMLKKYVVYYHEYLNVEKTKSREFFKVEKHPKQTKIWIGCKSNAISIQDKLNVANNVVNEMDNIMLV